MVLQLSSNAMCFWVFRYDNHHQSFWQLVSLICSLKWICSCSITSKMGIFQIQVVSKRKLSCFTMFTCDVIMVVWLIIFKFVSSRGCSLEKQMDLTQLSRSMKEDEEKRVVEENFFSPRKKHVNAFAVLSVSICSPNIPTFWKATTKLELAPFTSTLFRNKSNTYFD